MSVKNCGLPCPYCNQSISIPLIKPIQWTKQCPYCQQAIKYRNPFGRSFITFLLAYGLTVAICFIVMNEYKSSHNFLGIIAGIISQHFLGGAHFEKDEQN